MDCGGGSGGGHSSFGGGGCSSSGANFGGSDFGGMNSSHNTHFTSTTHSTFGAHPTSTATHWNSTTVSGSRINSGQPISYGVFVILAIFFICWLGVAGFIAYMLGTNVSPFLALAPICIALLPIVCFGLLGCMIYERYKIQRESRGGVNVNQLTTTQSQVQPPPQQGAPPHPGYPSSYPTSQQPQWTSAYSTNYGQQQYGMSGQQAPRPSAPRVGSPQEDKPPSYDDDVVKGGTTSVGFV